MKYLGVLSLVALVSCIQAPEKKDETSVKNSSSSQVSSSSSEKMSSGLSSNISSMSSESKNSSTSSSSSSSSLIAPATQIWTMDQLVNFQSNSGSIGIEKGIINNSIKFSDGYVAIDSMMNSKYKVSEFTWMAWIKPSQLGNTSGWHSIVSNCKAESGIREGWAFRVNSTGKLSFTYATIGTWSNNNSTQNIPVNSWSHVTVTFAQDSLKLFLNGEKIYSSVSSPLEYGNSYFTLGNSPFISSGNDAFWGNIDEVKFFDQALSKEEINTHL
jgi:hypothetical protein